MVLPDCFRTGLPCTCDYARQAQANVATMPAEQDDVMMQNLFAGTPAADVAEQRRQTRVDGELTRIAIADRGSRCRQRMP